MPILEAADSRSTLIQTLQWYIDCRGMETFAENWDDTVQAYEKDPTIHEDLSISEAKSALEAIVAFLTSQGIIPFECPLPPLPA
jgi:hypothetical protein